jgi:hypothetical protein
MHRLVLIALVVAVGISVTAVLDANGSQTAARQAKRTTTLRFDEITTYLKKVDTPPTDAGEDFETGDLVLFRSVLKSGTRKIGTDQGFCTVIELPKAQCTITFFLRQGHLAGADSFNFARRNQDFAFTGGTGSLLGASAQARLTAVSLTKTKVVLTIIR